MSRSSRILLISTILVLTFTLWMSGFLALLEMVTSMIFFAILVSVGVFLFLALLRKKVSFSRLVLQSLGTIGTIDAVLYSMIFLFACYQNELDPAYLARITLTNTEKTVVFQQMSHIASPEFYQEVSRDLQTQTESGFIVYYEGVGTGSAESAKMLDTALGIQFDRNTYATIAREIGMVEQDYRSLFSTVKGKDRLQNHDLDLDSLMRSYRSRQGSGSEISRDTVGNAPPISAEQIFSGSSLTPHERLVLQYLVRGILNFTTKRQDLLLSAVSRSGEQSDLFSVILDERNTHIANSIIRSNDTRIYALYGALHFDGIFRTLKERDPRWKIVGIERMRPY